MHDQNRRATVYRLLQGHSQAIYKAITFCLFIPWLGACHMNGVKICPVDKWLFLHVYHLLSVDVHAPCTCSPYVVFANSSNWDALSLIQHQPAKLLIIKIICCNHFFCSFWSLKSMSHCNLNVSEEGQNPPFCVQIHFEMHMKS